MKTYNELLKVCEAEKGKFIRAAIEEFRSSSEYRDARVGQMYYEKHNETIEKFKKYLTTLSGAVREDIFSSNYKLKTLFFRRLITQQVQYVLGNGVTLSEDNNKEKLGKDFDFKLQTVAKKAMAQGRAFGFWNLDHLEVFGYADTESEAGFCPLYDERTGALMAGIRYWFRTVNDDVVLRSTLYEPEGYTEYMQKNTEKPEILQERRGYVETVKKTGDGVIESVEYSDYGVLPIVPLYANDTYESELVGIRECIDCYDLIKSGMANEIDDTSGFYWILKNTGGMEDADLAQFIQRMKTVHAAVVDGDQGATAEAHTLEVPVDTRSKMLELLRKDIYEDFQALDVNSLSAAQKTAQEIQAAYQSQDNKCADFEYYVLDFVQQILELAGIDDNPVFNWNKIVNQSETTSMILSAANYLTEDMIIKKLPFLTPEEAEQVIAERDGEDFSQFNGDE